MRKIRIGDLVILDCPGFLLDACFGLTLAIHDPMKDYKEYDVEIILSNPPYGHPSRIMFRNKWVKILNRRISSS